MNMCSNFMSEINNDLTSFSLGSLSRAIHNNLSVTYSFFIITVCILLYNIRNSNVSVACFHFLINAFLYNVVVLCRRLGK